MEPRTQMEESITCSEIRRKREVECVSRMSACEGRALREFMTVSFKLVCVRSETMSSTEKAYVFFIIFVVFVCVLLPYQE